MGFTADVRNRTNWMVFALHAYPTPLYEEIPKVLRRRDPTGGFKLMSKSRWGTAPEKKVANSDSRQLFKRGCCVRVRGVGFRVLRDFIRKRKTESRK
jgi:hypothetical protein